MEVQKTERLLLREHFHVRAKSSAFSCGNFLVQELLHARAKSNAFSCGFFVQKLLHARAKSSAFSNKKRERRIFCALGKAYMYQIISKSQTEIRLQPPDPFVL